MYICGEWRRRRLKPIYTRFLLPLQTSRSIRRLTIWFAIKTRQISSSDAFLISLRQWRSSSISFLGHWVSLLQPSSWVKPTGTGSMPPPLSIHSRTITFLFTLSWWVRSPISFSSSALDLNLNLTRRPHSWFCLFILTDRIRVYVSRICRGSDLVSSVFLDWWLDRVCHLDWICFQFFSYIIVLVIGLVALSVCFSYWIRSNCPIVRSRHSLPLYSESPNAYSWQ